MLIILIVILFPLTVSHSAGQNNKTLLGCKTVTRLRDTVKDKLWMPNCKSTWHSAVVSDEAGHVYVLVVNAQVLHAAHELTVADREVLREFGDPSEEKGAGQVQGSKKQSSHKCFYISEFCSAFTSSTLMEDWGMKNSSQRDLCCVIFSL